MGVKVGSEVTPTQLTASLSAVDPETGKQLGRRYTPGGSYVDRLGVARRRRKFSAYDLVFSPPKSVSAAWALADDDTRKEIEQAFDASVGALVGFIQAEAVASRAERTGCSGWRFPPALRSPASTTTPRERETPMSTLTCWCTTGSDARTGSGARSTGG